MEDSNSSDDEPLSRKVCKRKRGKDGDEGLGAKTKKSRLKLTPPDSPDSGIGRAGKEVQDVGEEEEEEPSMAEAIKQKEKNNKREMKVSNDERKAGYAEEVKKVQNRAPRKTGVKKGRRNEEEESEEEESEEEVKKVQNRALRKTVMKKGRRNEEEESEEEVKEVQNRAPRKTGVKKGRRNEEEESEEEESEEEVKKVQNRAPRKTGVKKGRQNEEEESEEEESEEEVKKVQNRAPRKTVMKKGRRNEEKVKKNKENGQQQEQRNVDDLDSEPQEDREGSEIDEDKSMKKRESEKNGTNIQIGSGEKEENGRLKKKSDLAAKQDSGGSESEEEEQRKAPKRRQPDSPSGESNSEGECPAEKGPPKDDLPSGDESCDGGEKSGAVQAENKGVSGSDTDSSSLPSLEEDAGGSKAKPQPVKRMKEKAKGRGRTSKGNGEEENRTVSRLKHYIALCGVRRNYKKLLDGCQSVKSKVAVLKRELEELGVTGQPSIEKCKQARLRREEAQELAGLDVSNIISTQGRSRRRPASLWPPLQDAPNPASLYRQVLGSSSDSEGGGLEGSTTRRRATDWSNLRGIISDDADSE